MNIPWPLAINASGQTTRNRERECSKNHTLVFPKGSTSPVLSLRRKGHSHFGARSVLSVREHGKMGRTLLAAFFSIPLKKILSRNLGSGYRSEIERINLEPAVGREKAVQAIHVHREFENLVVTLLVRRGFSHSLGA